jgi:hypothetical protein
MEFNSAFKGLIKYQCQTEDKRHKTFDQNIGCVRYQWIKYTGGIYGNYLYIATNAHLLLVYININNQNAWNESY